MDIYQFDGKCYLASNVELKLVCEFGVTTYIYIREDEYWIQKQFNIFTELRKTEKWLKQMKKFKETRKQSKFGICKNKLMISTKQIIAMDVVNGQITGQEELLVSSLEAFTDICIEWWENFSFSDLSVSSHVQDVLLSEVAATGCNWLSVVILKLLFSKKNVNQLAKHFLVHIALITPSLDRAKTILLQKNGTTVPSACSLPPHQLKIYKKISKSLKYFSTKNTLIKMNLCSPNCFQLYWKW